MQKDHMIEKYFTEIFEIYKMHMEICEEAKFEIKTLNSVIEGRIDVNVENVCKEMLVIASKLASLNYERYKKLCYKILSFYGLMFLSSNLQK
jgi:hypothetical protein